MAKKILVFGLTTLDIINLCEKFPEEDEDVRVLKQYWQKGGNAANTSEVLAQLGNEVHLFSAFAFGNPMSDFAKRSLDTKGVNTKHCVVFQSNGFPTSCCIVTRNRGSRTIMHGRNDFPELTLEQFKTIDLSEYAWVHFEGRGFPHLTEMVCEAARIREETNLNYNISAEFEKPKRYEALISSGIANKADVLFISKDIALHLGYQSAKETVTNVKIKCGLKENLTIICPWGELGADAIDRCGIVYHADAFPPPVLIDTLGAGDTFIAGTLSSLLKGSSLQESLVFGCKVAGKKCGQFGFDDIAMDISS